MVVLRWGILGAGRISNDFVMAMEKCERQHKVVSIGASSLERAKEFVVKHKLQAKVYGNYEEVMRDKDVGKSSPIKHPLFYSDRHSLHWSPK
jgi:dihydrodiol dehydrogenase / D-xylose 1-dehydrogenase (NADP)